jgi:hypothetical protein
LNTGSVSNQATATGTPPIGDPVTDLSGTAADNDDTTVTALAQSPAWTVTKSSVQSSFAVIGDEIDYLILVENTGNVSISAVTVSDPGADDAPVRGADQAGNNDAILEPGEIWTYTATRTITIDDITEGEFINIATATGTPAGGTLADATGQETVTLDPNAILAVADPLGPFNGSDGATSDSVLDNDTLNGSPVSLATVTLAPGTAPAPTAGSITMNTDGEITVAPGTTAGVYTYTYEICEILNPDNCSTGEATVTVAAAAIVANNDDSFGTIDSNIGGFVGNILDNDTINDTQATNAKVSINIVSAANATVPGGLVPFIETQTGNIFVPVGTPTGFYNIEYQICEILNEDNCDTATVTIQVICDGTASISGIVFDDVSDEPLAGVMVNLVPQGNTPGPILVRITGEDGAYSFSGMVAGDYLVQVQDANLNAARGLYPVNSSLFFTTLGECLPQVRDFGYESTTLPVLGDFIWYDLNGNGIQDEWYDANNDGLITKNIPGTDGSFDFSQWEWVDLNGDGRWDGPENEGELNKAGFGQAASPNIRVSGPDGYVRDIIVGIIGYWRSRPAVNDNPLLGDFTVELIQDDNFRAAADAMASTGLIKNFTLTAAKAAASNQPLVGPSMVSAGQLTCDNTVGTLLETVLSNSNFVDLNQDFGVVCYILNTIVANDDDAGTVDNQVANNNILNAFANDTINDVPVERDEITVEIIEPATHPGVTLDTDTGFVSVAAGTPPGTYTIVYEICEVANTDNCDTATITVEVIEDVEETISGVKFNDLNGNGVRDENEPGLAGWLIYVDVNKNGQFDENEPNTISGPDGSWTLTSIPLGELIIREVIPAESKWVQTFPGVDANYQHTVTLSADQTITGILFGNATECALGIVTGESCNEVASITGFKWHDLDGDGSKDTDEPYMSNWTIFLDLNDSGALDADEPFQLTGQDGSFTFQDLQLGSYVVREVMKDGWLQTNPGRGDNLAHNVALTVGGSTESIQFGNAMPVSITGFVWRDKNANSNFDQQEPLLEGWVVFLDANGNGILDDGEISTRSVEEGYFEFTGLLPGTYNVVAINPTDWVQIYPGSNGYHSFTLRSGETASGDFGIAHVDDLVVVNPEPATIEGNIWYDYAEDAVWDHKAHLDRTDYVNREVSVEGWQITLTGESFAGALVQMSTFTKSDGSYSFQNVPAGEYKVNRAYRDDWVPAFPLLEWDNPLGQYHIVRVNGGYGGLASTGRRIYVGNKHNWIDELDKGADQLYVGVYLHVDTNEDGTADTRFFVSGPMNMAWDKSANRRSKYEIQSIDLIGTSKDYGRIEMSNHRFRKILGELQGQPGDSLVASKMDIPFELVVGGKRWILPDSQTPSIEGLVSQMLPYNQKHVSTENNRVEFIDVFGAKLGRLVSLEFMPLYGADFGTNQSVFGTAPDDKYPVIIEDAGARHVLHHYEPHRDLFLGTGFASSQIVVRNLSNAGFGARKSQNIAENGVLFLTPIQSGRTTQIQVQVEGSGYLHAWFDLNKDEVWTVDEKLIDGVFLEKGTRTVSIEIPIGVAAGESYARFRLSKQQELDSVNGVQSGGEIEDYQIQILSTGGTVQGTVWVDHNVNGSRDQGEPGAAGIRVFADMNTNGIFDQGEPFAFTSATGTYALGGLKPGTVRIQPDYDGKWMVTNIAGPNYIVASVLDGQIINGVNFGIVSVTTSIDDDETMPLEFGLDQNYPNPFNPTTTIRYRLAESAAVTLTVYDMNGRVVSTLVNDRQNAGEYTVAIDASSLASGVYVYRLVAGSHVFTQKLTLVK